MRFLIVSHTPHFRSEGGLVGWGPTVREIDRLAELFDEVVHLAPLLPGPAPASSLPYRSERVRVRTVRASGGDGWPAKLGIVRAWPEYAAAVWRELKRADAVQVRCPANISLLASLLLAFAKRPARRWIKYAGNWAPEGRESWSYAFQRRWLRGTLHRAAVTVNGNWSGQPGHVHSFLNPCLTAEEAAGARDMVRQKQLGEPVRLLYVGRLERPKGVERCIGILERLVQRRIPAEMDLVGDGPERSAFVRMANWRGLRDQVHFHGWLPRTALAPLYAKAHFTLFPATSSEGWPKVLSEGMAYGAVPLAGSVSSIPQYLEEFQTGRAHPPLNLDEFVSSIARYLAHPSEWERESANGMAAAGRFTYDHYVERVRALLDIAGKPHPGQALDAAAPLRS